VDHLGIVNHTDIRRTQPIIVRRIDSSYLADSFTLPPGALYIVSVHHGKVVHKQFGTTVRVTVKVRVSQHFLKTKRYAFLILALRPRAFNKICFRHEKGTGTPYRRVPPRTEVSVSVRVRVRFTVTVDS